MPRAEVGSTKYLSNKLKSKGLQRLRWYCQVCEKQCRDENGFKCHTQSESHVRNMQLVASQGGKKIIEDYSHQFEKAFIEQLRTSHGTKPIHINHFYQEYISHKEHTHMNATKWTSLTQFAKYLGQNGICRVEETDKGLHIAWIDNSPGALRRQEAIRKRERMEKGDEEKEKRELEEQVARAQAAAAASSQADEMNDAGHLERKEGERLKFNLGLGNKFGNGKPPSPPQTSASPDGEGQQKDEFGAEVQPMVEKLPTPPVDEPTEQTDESTTKDAANAGAVKFSMSFGPSKPKNVFSSKNNPLASRKIKSVEQHKKMSEAERIMKEELEQKRQREERGHGKFENKRRKIGT